MTVALTKSSNMEKGQTTMEKLNENHVINTNIWAQRSFPTCKEMIVILKGNKAECDGCEDGHGLTRDRQKGFNSQYPDNYWQRIVSYPN